MKYSLLLLLCFGITANLIAQPPLASVEAGAAFGEKVVEKNVVDVEGLIAMMNKKEIGKKTMVGNIKGYCYGCLHYGRLLD